jgi:hypothetical protein
MDASEAEVGTLDDVLHSARVKGIASPEAIAEATGLEVDQVTRRLGELDAQGLTFERAARKRPGWVLSEEGRARHAAELAASHPAEVRDRLAVTYEGFLALNTPVKTLAARWQQATDGAARFDVLTDLEDLHGRAVTVLAASGEVLPRFGRYARRLSEALAKIDDDPRFFVSPLVDSYHTIWFECHEDYLLTLGRTRTQEGSE